MIRSALLFHSSHSQRQLTPRAVEKRTVLFGDLELFERYASDMFYNRGIAGLVLKTKVGHGVHIATRHFQEHCAI
jgi:hypothetical protein